MTPPAGAEAPAARPRRVVPRDAIGVGLRPVHYAEIARDAPEVDFFEVIAENVLDAPPLARARFAAVADAYPVVAHGVSLNLCGAEPLDEAHLAALRAMVEAHGMPWASDHLCWSRTGATRHHDLLPAPLSAALVPWVAARVRVVAAALGVPFAVENLSSYVAFTRDDLREWEFLRGVAEAADCGVLLDVNNLVVSSHNHGFAVEDYLDGVPWERVVEVHVAGHEVLPDGRRIDAHDRAVSEEVWAVYRAAWRRGGPFPTLLEWDDRVPSLSEVRAEAARARAWRA